MKLHRFSFANSEFQKLPEAERRLLANVAHARNDIRHLSFLIIGASNAVKAAGNNDKVIALHHYQHILRILAGTLFEAWEIIRKGWDGEGIGKTRHEKLSAKGKEGIKSLRKYFNDKDNNLYRIRNKVGFHYDMREGEAFFTALSKEAVHQIWTGDLANNVFHVFPETAMNFALFGITAEDDTDSAIRKAKKVGDDILAVMDYFTYFSDNMLVSSIKELSPKRGSVEVSKGLDPTKCLPVVIASNVLSLKPSKRKRMS